MIGDATEDTGALKGAEGFLAGVGGVARKEEGDAQDAHAGLGRWWGVGRRQGRRWGCQDWGNVEMVDEVPLAVVFDGAKAAGI